MPEDCSVRAGDPGALAWYWVARGIVEVVCRVVWRVKITGTENLPQSGGYVLAPVHRSFIDTFLCGCLTRRRVRFIGKDTLWRYAWSARLVSSLGAIAVQRGMPDREALRACEAAVRGGEPVVLFPEGTRQSGPDVKTLFEGAAFVAARTGVPIVPVGIGGSEWAMAKGSRMVRPVRITMVIGTPIPPPARGEGGARVPRTAIRQVTERLAGELQRCYDQAMADAGRSGQIGPR